MGGRGGTSGKKPVSSGANSQTAGIGGKTGGSVTVSGAKKESTSKSGSAGDKGKFTPSKTPVSKMSDKKLREELTKAAGYYYASGKSGISFGGHDPYLAAAALASRKMSRSRMEKEYKSILKRLKEI